MRHSSSLSSWVSLKLRVSARIERERSFNFWLSTAREFWWWFWWWSQWTMGVAANEKVALVPPTLNRFNFIEFVSRTAGRESSRTKKSVPASSCWNCPQTTSRSKLSLKRGKILAFKKSKIIYKVFSLNEINKSSGKKILNTTFYPDQKWINKFIKGKSELKGNKQVKTKNFESEENVKNLVVMTKRLCDQWMG